MQASFTPIHLVSILANNPTRSTSEWRHPCCSWFRESRCFHIAVVTSPKQSMRVPSWRQNWRRGRKKLGFKVKLRFPCIHTVLETSWIDSRWAVLQTFTRTLLLFLPLLPYFFLLQWQPSPFPDFMFRPHILSLPLLLFLQVCVCERESVWERGRPLITHVLFSGKRSMSAADIVLSSRRCYKLRHLSRRYETNPSPRQQCQKIASWPRRSCSWLPVLWPAGFFMVKNCTTSAGWNEGVICRECTNCSGKLCSHLLLWIVWLPLRPQHSWFTLPSVENWVNLFPRSD